MPRKQLTIGVVGLLLIGALTAVGLSWAIKAPSGCSALPKSTDGTVTPIVLVVELVGNTADDAKNVQTFITDELAAVAKDLTKPFSVRVAFVVDGKKYVAPGCLSQPRYILPPKEDLSTYKDSSTSEDTRKQLESSMTQYRRDRIGWIAQEASDQVRQVDFKGASESDPQLSPRFVLNVAASYEDSDSVVAILSPFTSTVKDCFAPGAESMDQQVGDCLRYKQVGVLKAEATAFEVEPSLLDTSLREVADATRDALCKLATPDGCTLAAG